jgi:hypothetical protein
MLKFPLNYLSVLSEKCDSSDSAWFSSLGVKQTLNTSQGRHVKTADLFQSKNVSKYNVKTKDKWLEIALFHS